MAVFKREICKTCGYSRNESNPKENGVCRKCGAPTYYSDNWYMSYKHNGKRTMTAIGKQKRLAQNAYEKVKTKIREKRMLRGIETVFCDPCGDPFNLAEKGVKRH